jgi:hypothetical protein
MLRGPIRALRAITRWRVWALGAAVVIGLAVFEARDAWSPADGGHQRAIAKLAIYWGLWLAWPAALWLLLRVAGQLRRGRPFGALPALALLVATGGLLWSRFVEPHQLRVVETSIGSTTSMRCSSPATGPTSRRTTCTGSSRRSRCCAIRPMPCSATTTSRCPARR